MNPDRVIRSCTCKLTDLPNVGTAIARELESIGVRAPAQLRGQDPLALYEALCAKRGRRIDPCVLDVFLSITDFMNGHPPRRWWEYTQKRKQRYGGLLEDGKAGSEA
ncbi:MAG: helix-hairpin-helix domain-containing protein [Gammaproteobacteria bacterium]|jgi:hypothetical protein